MKLPERLLTQIGTAELNGWGVKDVYWSLWNSITSRYPIGENVYNRDWDVLVLLDTCRVDALKAVADEYEFITDVGKLLSVGSKSPEWVLKTFTEQYSAEIAETVFVAGNVWAYRILTERLHERTVDSDYSESSYRYLDRDGVAKWRTVDSSAFKHVDHPWQLSLDEVGRIHPESHGAPGVVTDRAVAMWRDHTPDRMIVWYSLPHFPYVADAVAEDRDLYEYESDPIRALRSGESRETVYESYLENLRLALDHVEVLLQNVDAETVAISADHGEAFGEYGLYSHRFGIPHPQMKYVPWCETTATDTGEYTPTYPEPELNNVEQAETEELLKSMGYL